MNCRLAPWRTDRDGRTLTFACVTHGQVVGTIPRECGHAVRDERAQDFLADRHRRQQIQAALPH